MIHSYSTYVRLWVFTINFSKLPNLMTSWTIRTPLEYTPTLYFRISGKYFMWYKESSKFFSHYSLHTNSCANNLMINGHLTSGYTSDQHIIKPFRMYPLLIICTHVVKEFYHYVICKRCPVVKELYMIWVNSVPIICNFSKCFKYIELLCCYFS